MRLRSISILIILLLSSCSLPDAGSAPAALDREPVAVAAIPDKCRGDGAVQTWQLLPVQPATSELMAAYGDREVVEFSGSVFGSDDDPSRQPHRRYLISEAAEGITITLDYQGDPPPLAVGPRYRFVAWADFVPSPANPLTATVTPTPLNQLPDAAGYELQVHDSIGLLFLGLTDTDLADDPLGIEVSNAEGDCPAVVITNNPCIETRQVQPLRIRWDNNEITLYPGEDGQLQHQGMTYNVSVFRNRQVTYTEPGCAGYSEHARSLRVDRIDPPPVVPAPPTPVTPTLPLTGTESLSGAELIPLPPPPALP